MTKEQESQQEEFVMNVKEIVRNYISDNKFDGLVNQHPGCGCQLSDLAPCGRIQEACEPAYKLTPHQAEITGIEVDGDYTDYEFIMSPVKP